MFVKVVNIFEGCFFKEVAFFVGVKERGDLVFIEIYAHLPMPRERYVHNASKVHFREILLQVKTVLSLKYQLKVIYECCELAIMLL